MAFDFETLADAADMDLGQPFDLCRTVMAGAQLHFKTAPCVVEALVKRASSGHFGYTDSDIPTYLNAVTGWMGTVRGWPIQPEWVVSTYGTLQAMCCALRLLTDPGDGIIVQPPVYVLYDRILSRTQRTRVDNPLVLEDGRYHMDLAHLEQLMRRPRNKVMLLCNPHNPIMDIWGEHTLRQVAALAKRHGVTVICDEIFAEHAFPGTHVIPYGALAEARDNCIICTSLGKAFNFTGVSHANIIIPNEDLRNAFIGQRNADHYGSLSPFMYTAVTAAYTPQGKAWIDALIAHVGERIPRIEAFFAHEIPQVKLCRHTAGTLLWLDLRGLGMTEEALGARFAAAGVVMDQGSKYGKEGTLFSRMQIGMPDKELFPALARLAGAFRQSSD